MPPPWPPYGPHLWRRFDRTQVQFEDSIIGPNPVSWQSAFWALVPLALNFMTQPSGQVCCWGSEYCFFLKSSPFMCVFDALHLVIRIALYVWKDPRTALQKATERRFRDVDPDAEGSFISLQKNTPFRLVLFVIGAVPQIFKLFAARGIPWTQAFGAIYLVSFLLIELLVVSTKRNLDSKSFEVVKRKMAEVPEVLNPSSDWIELSSRQGSTGNANRSDVDSSSVSVLNPFSIEDLTGVPNELDVNSEGGAWTTDDEWTAKESNGYIPLASSSPPTHPDPDNYLAEEIVARVCIWFSWTISVGYLASTLGFIVGDIIWDNFCL